MKSFVPVCIGARDNAPALPEKGKKPLATYVRSDAMPGPEPSVDTPLGLVLERMKDGPLTCHDVADWILDVSNTKASSLLSEWRRKGWIRRGEDIIRKGARPAKPAAPKPTAERFSKVASHIREHRYARIEDIARIVGLSVNSARSQCAEWAKHKRIVQLGMGCYALPEDPCDDLDIYAVRTNPLRQKYTVNARTGEAV